MWTGTMPPGGGPPLHYHLNEDEIFHVLEGRVAFFLDGEWREVGPGGSAFMPRGVAHTFKNVGDAPSRVLIMTIPSGFEKFFARCAEEFARPDGPDMPQIVKIGVEHGIHFVQEQWRMSWQCEFGEITIRLWWQSCRLARDFVFARDTPAVRPILRPD
ncbi:MAG: cupin domain-containing protein [Verrucomicrobia bacterium]|nr:MAG: cupin domain-containing protein [Verrucomicrobiota bacterium]